MKIDNMREEHQEKLIKDAEKMAAAAGSRKRRRKSRQKDDGIYFRIDR